MLIYQTRDFYCSYTKKKIKSRFQAELLKKANLLNIGGILSRGFEEGNSKLVCILLRRCVIHHLKKSSGAQKYFDMYDWKKGTAVQNEVAL